MFTGIIEEVGAVRAVAARAPGIRLTVDCVKVTDELGVGDSISVSGCCLTAIAVDADGFAAEAMGETLERTAIGDLRAGSQVNLERAARLADRLGGHLVQGHVDGVGVVTGIEPRQQWTVMTCSLPSDLAQYVIDKGSIAVDGVSLTVMGADDRSFHVGLIPHTLGATTLGRRAVGDRVNLETDIVGKYVERMVRGGVPTPYGPQ